LIITFLVRSQSFTQPYLRFITEVEGAFDLAYILQNNLKVIEFKCLVDECLLTEIPGSSYKPGKLVQKFDYTRE
jgi:hypothetical protein